MILNKKIEVGDYIRTNRGIIGKIKRIELDENDTSLKWYVFDKKRPDMNIIDEVYINKPYIEKYSKNIKELLEEGDIIKFEYNNAIYIEEIIRFNCGDTYFLEVCFSPEDGIGYNVNIFDEDINIKSIVTKEQFNSIEYKVGE